MKTKTGQSLSLLVAEGAWNLGIGNSMIQEVLELQELRFALVLELVYEQNQ